MLPGLDLQTCLPGFLRYLSFHRLQRSSRPWGKGGLPSTNSQGSLAWNWLTRNTQAWSRLGSQIAHIEHIVKWVKLSKGTGCFWDHMWVGVWKTGKSICMKASVWLYSRIQYYCLPSFLFRVTNMQAHGGAGVVSCWTEAAYSGSLTEEHHTPPIEWWFRSYLLLLRKYFWSLVIWPYLNTPRQSCFKTSSFISSQSIPL